jgi:hypothetical protein
MAGCEGVILGRRGVVRSVEGEAEDLPRGSKCGDDLLVELGTRAHPHLVDVLLDVIGDVEVGQATEGL